MREFNLTGICVPNRHYMVDISEKIEKIFELVEGEKYFNVVVRVGKEDRRTYRKTGKAGR